MEGEKRFLEEECKSVAEAVSLVEDLLARETLSNHETVALGTYLHNIYSGIERLLRCLLEERHEICLGAGPTWHKDLLRRAQEVGVLSLDQFEGFLRLLAFRHVHVHGYGHMLDETRLREVAGSVPSFVREFLRGVTGEKDTGP